GANLLQRRDPRVPAHRGHRARRPAAAAVRDRASGDRPQRPDGPRGFAPDDAAGRTPPVTMAIALPRTRIELARAPFGLLALACVVVAGVLLAPAYLVVRAAESTELWERLTADSTLTAFGNTLLLTVAVTAASIGLAVPPAWLS